MALSMLCVKAPVCKTLGVQAPVRLSVRHNPSRGDSLVVAAKGKSRMRQQGGMAQQAKPPTPPVDPDNEEFVVFVRATQLPRWIPFTIVKGGAQANILVKAMQGNFAKEFYSKILLNQIGKAIYKEKDVITKGIRNGFPGYKNFTSFEFGFKIRNKEIADDWMNAKGIMLLPPESELPEGVWENMKQSFGALFPGDKKVDAVTDTATPPTTPPTTPPPSP